MKSLLLAVVGAIGVFASPALGQDATDSFSGFYGGATLSGGGIAPLSGNADSTEQFIFGGLGAFGGYNVRSGNMFFGVEVGAETQSPGTIRDYTRTTESITLPNPYEYGSVEDGGPTSGQAKGPDVPGGLLTQEDHQSETLREVAAGTISARVGYVSGDTAVYLRVGGGAALVQHRVTIDRTKSTYCDAFSTTYNYSGGNYELDETGCVGPHSGNSESYLYQEVPPVPKALVGLGVEQQFGQAFLRAEADMSETFYIDGGGIDNPLVQYGVAASAGFHF